MQDTILSALVENQKLFYESKDEPVAQFKRISVPLVRRIYPQLIANKIVSVQPLLGPTGLIYYLDRFGAKEEWIIKKKKKKDWRKISDPWEPSVTQ